MATVNGGTGGAWVLLGTGQNAHGCREGRNFRCFLALCLHRFGVKAAGPGCDKRA